MLSLFFFAVVALLWLGDLPQYSSLLESLNSLLLASIGQQDYEEFQASQKSAIIAFHISFLMVNIIGFITLLSGLMSDTLQGLDPIL